MAANNRVPTGSLMVFSKMRLFLLFLASMLIGTAFFFFGFFMGYQTGKTQLIHSIHNSIKNNRKLDSEIVKKLKLKDKDNLNRSTSNAISNVRYIVHIGLFSNAEYAAQAWQEVVEYSKLSEKDAIQEININRQTFFQVKVGIFTEEAHAQTFANMINTRSNYKISPIISRILINNTNKNNSNPMKDKTLQSLKKSDI